jgi:hypothetical protein
VAEWFKAAVLKTAERASVPWVRIPPRPPIAAGATGGAPYRAAMSSQSSEAGMITWNKVVGRAAATSPAIILHKRVPLP